MFFFIFCFSSGDSYLKVKLQVINLNQFFFYLDLVDAVMTVMTVFSVFHMWYDQCL